MLIPNGNLGHVCPSEPNQCRDTDIERLISSKNETIISALKKGTDTLDEEKQVVVLKKALQLKDGARRKLMSELRILAGAAPNSRGGMAARS
jgi:hypothetical protein